MQCVLKDAEYGQWVSWCDKKGLRWHESYKSIKEVITTKNSDVCKECLHKLITLLRIKENESLTLLI